MVLARASLNLRITSALERPCGRIDSGDTALWLRSSKALSSSSALPAVLFSQSGFCGAAIARSMALNKTTLCQQDVFGGFADRPAVLTRLPVPLHFAHVLHIGEILFL